MNDAGRGESLREGLRLTIVGPPNAGKSSLINALARRDAAIVSETPGTTRDVIELRLDLGGYLIHVADTAGLRETQDVIETEGVRRALAQADAGDLTLLLLDGSADEIPRDIAADIVVRNKSDLASFKKGDGISLSLKTGEGFSELIAALTAMVEKRLETKDQTIVLSRPRHRRELQEALQAAATFSNKHLSRNCSPKICAWRCAPWAASPAGSMSKNCWISRLQRFCCIGK